MPKKEETAAKDVFLHVSTQHLRPDQRLEYWRSLHGRIEIDAADAEGAKDYRASLMRYADPTGVEFGYATSDANIVGYGKPESDLVIVSVPVAGEMLFTTRNDDRIRVRASSGLTIVNGVELEKSRSDGFSHVYLTLERTHIEAALGIGAGMLARGVYSVPEDGLTRMLQSHLQSMALHGDQLDANGAMIATKAATDLVLGVMASQNAQLVENAGDLTAAACFEAASRYITLNISNVSLTADDVAQALGVSRAHLYRLFEQEQLSIGDMIRSQRIARASDILRDDPGRPIKQVAFMVGYQSAASFTRAFRDITGYSPSDFRQSLVERLI
ncbi:MULTISPECIES: helix-turn-helix transcriptional regulator [Thalassospira]|uniref:HTH araC/xylS-type domain-containing protein n=2 Tax=Thalassospira TaxID=168934 RepID=A0A367WGZ7_9PROT|nr:MULTISPECIES: helix-turn-helix transcriptional regulator [Thalassospira]MDG4718873.1 helix-turn-helix transcriptional regulator [Thalassospira sp. FZY0004]RCK39841.1 hypothetical protein TH19_02005 [Thalassospira profundimaris]